MGEKEKYKDIIEEEKYECICEVCSKPFIGIDEDATLCDECWERIMEENFEENNLTFS